MTETLTTPTIDLSKFCAADDSSRLYAMSLPFVRGGWRYATDARILVRVPAPGDVDTPEPKPRKFPDAQGKFAEVPDLAALCVNPLPPMQMIRLLEDCPQCRGRGSIICECCDEEASECLMCDGRKRLMTDKGMRIGTRFIGPDYVRLLYQLPGVRTGDASRAVMAFTFDGGEGLVMGMTEDYARGIELRAAEEK